MHKFLWSGKDADGRERNERVEAENAQAAKAILSARGWTDLELLNDEIGDAAGRNIPSVPAEWKESEAWQSRNPEDPDIQAAYFKNEGPGFWMEWGKDLLGSKVSLLLFGVTLAGGLCFERRWAVIIGAAGLGCVVLLFPALWFFFSRTSRLYSGLLRARVWCRWNEIFVYVEKLRRSHRLTRLGVGDFELARSNALGLAGLGRMDDALREMAPFEKDPSIEPWFYWSMLSGVYDNARQFEKAHELRQQAALAKPDTASLWIDVGYSHAFRLNRPAEARAAIARARDLEMPGLAKQYLPFLEGIILWREGKPAEAKPQLERAIAGFQSIPQNPLMEGLILLVKGFLCAVEGELGNIAAAKSLFREAGKYLVANREDEILDACRKHLSPAESKQTASR